MNITSNKPRPVYPCSQQDLYTIVTTGWGSYGEHLPEFEAYSSRYTAATGTDQLTALDVAKALPDRYGRQDAHMSARVDLQNLTDTCMVRWTHMVSFIREGFPADKFEIKRNAAGYTYYREAGQLNWDAVAMLMQKGLDFANDNTAELTTGGMPATFVADMEAETVAFNAKHQEFLQAMETARQQTIEKLDANNELYRALMSMFEDGKHIFRHEPGLREQFTFESLRYLIGRSTGSDSEPVADDTIVIGAYLFDEVDNGPIGGGLFRIMNPPDQTGPIQAVSGVDGTLGLVIPGYPPNAVNTIDYEIDADGYEMEYGSIELVSGQEYSVEIPLVPVVVDPLDDV